MTQPAQIAQPRAVVFPNFKIGFILMRKNASTSLQSAVRALGKNPADPMSTRPILDYARNREAIREYRCQGFEFYGIIRHPIQRLVGAWNYFHPRNIDGRNMPDNKLGLVEWIEAVTSWNPRSLDEHLAPQSIQLFDDRGCLADKLFEFEKITEEWDLFRAMNPRLKLPVFPHGNPRQDNGENLTLPESLEKTVRERWCWDFDRLGYQR